MMPFSPRPPKPSSVRQPGLSRTHSITIGGIKAVPHLSGALYLGDERVLLVADLHLEQGASLARRGLHLPPYDTLDTLNALEQVIAEVDARRLILLGDSFHDRVAHEALSEDVAVRLKTLTAKTETIWISGNHDPVAHDVVGGRCAEEVALGPLTLRHIPKRGLKSSFEISGHLHPGATIEQRGVSVRTKCFVSDGQRLILPAFGRYTGAMAVTSSAFIGLFDAPATHVWMIGNGVMHKFPLSRVR